MIFCATSVSAWPALAQKTSGDAADDRLLDTRETFGAPNMDAVGAVGVARAVVQPDKNTDIWTENFLQVDLNQQGLNETVLLLRTKDGGIYLCAKDLVRWRVKLPARVALHVNYQDYFLLQALDGAQYQINEAKQSLSIELAASAFEGSSLSREMPLSSRPLVPDAGLLFNYDLLAQHSGTQNQVSGLFELGGFTAYGAGTASFIGSNAENKKHAIRLDTVWTVDQPESLSSWRIGDTISRSASAWGRSVRFGGLQYSSNFIVQPGLVTMPQQSITGQAALPSSVDVFVNNALVQRSDIAPGPFSLNSIPVVTGQGNVRVVVRDVLGREQVINKPFYASTRLLRSGLNDFSYEIGKQRENYTLTSNDYGPWLAAGTARRGFSDVLTGEVHAEAMSGKQKTLGLNGVFGLPAVSTVVNGSVAASDSTRGTGYLSGLGFEMQDRRLNLSGRTQFTTQNFTQIGIEPGQLAPRRLLDLAVGYSAGSFGTFGAAYVRQDNRDKERAKLVSLSYSRNIGNWAFIGVTVLKSLTNSANNSIGAFLVIPLDQSTIVTANAQHSKSSNGLSQGNVNVQRSLGPGNGFGYRLQASHNGPQQAEVSAQNAVGTYTLAAATQDGTTATRASASGGLVALGGSVFASRRVTDSFALVQVPGFQNVRVYTDNQLVGKTDADGNALIPRIRAYEKNRVSIESLDLPLDAKVNALTLNAVPYFRSGVVVKFPVTRARGGTLTVLLADGTALPIGAQVRVDNSLDVFPVGADGEVYLSGLADKNVLNVIWQGSSCRIPVPYPATKDPLPFLGIFVCEGVSR